MVKMAEKEIPGVVMNHKREWRQWKRDLDEGRGERLSTRHMHAYHEKSHHITRGASPRRADARLRLRACP